MSASRDASLVRRFLEQELPLLPSANPNRVGPVHIANNFVTLGLGAGSLHQPLADLIVEGKRAEEILDQPATAADADALSHLLDVIFDSDGNVYSSRSSPLPLMPSSLGRDQSDDNYAKYLWGSLGPENRRSISIALGLMVKSPTPGDGVIGRIGYVLEQALDVAEQKPPATTDGQSDFGIRLGALLERGIRRSSTLGGALRQLDSTRSLSVMLGLFVVLGLLYEASPAVVLTGKKRKPKDPREVLGLFVFCGETPGSLDDHLVALAIRSLGDQIASSRQGINHVMNQKIQNGMNSSGRRSRVDRISDTVVDSVPGDPGLPLIERLVELEEAKLLERAGFEMMPESHLALAVKSLGYKCGFSAPQRNGAPRLVLETSMLSALVHFFGESDMTSQELASRIHSETGMIVGNPHNITKHTIENLIAISSNNVDVEEALQSNQSLLDERLVKSGLARQYSDGTTVVEDGLT